jgi:hypothetical protein
MEMETSTYIISCKNTTVKGFDQLMYFVSLPEYFSGNVVW